MTHTTAPTPTAKEREKIEHALNRAFASDPIDRMLPGYRPLTTEDVLRFDVHWLGRIGAPGSIEPLWRTNRMNIKPLRILRGFLQRLEAGYATPHRVNAGEQTASQVKRAGHGFVTNICAYGEILNGTGRLGDFAWSNAVLRKHDKGLRAPAQDRIRATWGLTSNGGPFWNGPSGPFAWTRPDGRFVLADNDGWGCPLLLDAVWRSKDNRSDGADGTNQQG